MKPTIDRFSFFFGAVLGVGLALIFLSIIALLILKA